jgi:hypothetical protein
MSDVLRPLMNMTRIRISFQEADRGIRVSRNSCKFKINRKSLLYKLYNASSYPTILAIHWSISKQVKKTLLSEHANISRLLFWSCNFVNKFADLQFKRFVPIWYLRDQEEEHHCVLCNWIFMRLNHPQRTGRVRRNSVVSITNMDNVTYIKKGCEQTGASSLYRIWKKT